MHFLDVTQHLAYYGIGKGSSLKMFTASHPFREQAKVFNIRPASMQDVVNAGEKALVIIYNGKLTDTLDSLQHRRFCENVASKSCHVKPQVLPPTSGAAKYHSRVIPSSPGMERIRS